MPRKKDSDRGGGTNARRRLIYLLGEAVEKIWRIRQILKRQRIYSAVEHKEFEYAAPIKTLSGAIDRLEREGLTANSDQFLALLHGGPLSSSQLSALLGQLQKVLRGVQGIHELLVLLPREAVLPQVFFLLQDSFGSAPEAAMVLTNFLCSYEFRVEDVLKKLDLPEREVPEFRDVLKDFDPGGSLLGLAFADRDNPLAWPVLTHEYGHALDDARRISSQIVHGDMAASIEKEDADRAKVRWTSELLCDFISAHVMGPISLLPILLIEMTQLQIAKGWEHHPPTPVRLRFVREYLKAAEISDAEFEEVFELYQFDYAEKRAKMKPRERKLEAGVVRLATELFSSVGTDIAAKVGSLGLPTFSNLRLEIAKKSITRLQEGSPISSVRQSSNEDLSVTLNSLEAGTPTEEVYRVLSELDETPLHGGEILTAGWLHKLRTFEFQLHRSFETYGTDTSVADGYGDYLSQMDALLEKSLELIAVQAALREAVA